MRSPTPCSCLSSRPLKESLWPSGVDVSPKCYQRTSQSPRTFHQYLSILCVSSSAFPAVLSNLTFQVPIVMLILARSDLVHQLHNFYLHPDGQQPKARPLFWAKTEPVWIEMGLSSSCDVSWAMLHGGAHPSPCRTTADVLHLGGSPWS